MSGQERERFPRLSRLSLLGSLSDRHRHSITLGLREDPLASLPIQAPRRTPQDWWSALSVVRRLTSRSSRERRPLLRPSPRSPSRSPEPALGNRIAERADRLGSFERLDSRVPLKFGERLPIPVSRRPLLFQPGSEGAPEH